MWLTHNAIDSINFKAKVTGQAGSNETKEVEIMVSLKYRRNFLVFLEVLLNNCEINLILTSFANCVIVYTDIANQDATFAITETKLYVLVITLSTQDHAKLL